MVSFILLGNGFIGRRKYNWNQILMWGSRSISGQHRGVFGFIRQARVSVEGDVREINTFLLDRVTNMHRRSFEMEWGWVVQILMTTTGVTLRFHGIVGQDRLGRWDQDTFNVNVNNMSLHNTALATCRVAMWGWWGEDGWSKIGRKNKGWAGVWSITGQNDGCELALRSSSVRF